MKLLVSNKLLYFSKIILSKKYFFFKLKFVIFKRVILYLLFINFIFLASCSKNNSLIKKPEKVPALTVLYNNAYKAYNDGNFERAIELFRKVETKYYTSEWAKKASLMIIYIYYEAGDQVNTLKNAVNFKKVNPKYEDIDYIDYIIALSFYENVNVVSRDQTNTKAALKSFKELMENYPNSIYFEDAKYKIDLLNELIAGNHMYIGRYYMNKNNWLSAIRRFKIVINQYDTTLFAEEALHRLVEIYYKLGNLKEAEKYAAILGYNFNRSDWYKKSYKIINNDYLINKKKQTKIKDQIKIKDRILKILNLNR